MSDAPPTLREAVLEFMSRLDASDHMAPGYCDDPRSALVDIRAALAAPDPLPAALDLLEAFDWYAMHAGAVVDAARGFLAWEVEGHRRYLPILASCLAALPTPPIERTRSLLVAHGRGKWKAHDQEAAHAEGRERAGVPGDARGVPKGVRGDLRGGQPTGETPGREDWNGGRGPAVEGARGGLADADATVRDVATADPLPAAPLLVVVESPYAGDVERNVKYAKACMLDCLHRGEAPFASHLLYAAAFGHEDSRSIPLSRGLVATVDAGDLPRLTEFHWMASGTRGSEYAVKKRRIGGGKTKITLMHRFILDAPPGSEVDHINGNRLDNRRCNLRLCTHAENMQNVGPKADNTSGLKGVRRSRDGKRWVAYIKDLGKQKHLGTFDTPDKAARAYDEHAVRAFGRFARLNFPSGGVLDDLDADQRQQGIDAGLAWGDRAAATVVYTDHGISRGMEMGIAHAKAAGRPVEFRRLPEEPSSGEPAPHTSTGGPAPVAGESGHQEAAAGDVEEVFERPQAIGALANVLLASEPLETFDALESAPPRTEMVCLRCGRFSSATICFDCLDRAKVDLPGPLLGFSRPPGSEATPLLDDGDLFETMERVRQDRDALAAFKAYVHWRLDAARIPTHPDGPHSKEGCRVGDRLDLLVGERDAARLEWEHWKQACEGTITQLTRVEREVNESRLALTAAQAELAGLKADNEALSLGYGKVCRERDAALAKRDEADAAAIEAFKGCGEAIALAIVDRDLAQVHAARLEGALGKIKTLARASLSRKPPWAVRGDLLAIHEQADEAGKGEG
jgi:hypothetical protein